MPFFNRGRIQLNKTFFNSFGSGGGPIPPLPPIRPDSYLKYSFTQEPTQAIIDRVDSSKQLTTTIGTDVNVIQTKTGEIQTFNPLQQAFDVSVGAFIEPLCENLVINSGNPELYIASTVGSASPYVLTLNYAEAPDGTMTAHRLQMSLNGGTSSGDFTRFITNAPDSPSVETEFTQSWFMKSNDANTYQVGSLIKSQSSSDNYEVTPEWQRLSKTRTLTTIGTSCGLQLRGSINASDTIDILIWMSPKMGQQLEIGSVASSYIATEGAPAQRDASTPQVPADNVPDSRVVVYTQFIANSEASSNNPVNIAELQFSNDDIVIGYTYDEIPSLVLANSFFVTTPNGSFVIEYTPDQIISKGDEIKINLYINETIVTLEYENITNGEKGLLQNTSVFVDLGVGDIIKLGQTDALSANYMTLIDFIIT